MKNIQLINLQDNSPSNKRLSAVGGYLLVGLSFVVGAILEYAYLLWLKRRSELKARKQVKTETKRCDTGTSHVPKTLEQLAEIYPANQENCALELTSYSYKVDCISHVVSFILFALFNLIYWLK